MRGRAGALRTVAPPEKGRGDCCAAARVGHQPADIGGWGARVSQPSATVNTWMFWLSGSVTLLMVLPEGARKDLVAKM